jgi:hypothetical protein
MRYEYEVRNVEHDRLRQELDRMGERGWELVTLTPGPFHSKLIFKRPFEAHPAYSVSVTLLSSTPTSNEENPMALGTIAPGSTGQFGAVLLNNGAPDTSGFTPSFSFTASDPSVTFAPATTDASGGTIPLGQQTVMSVPTGDTLGSVIVTATCVDPTGATQSGSVTVAIGGGTTPPANVFSVGVTQLA